jgi:uncharacterized protein YndB with AHSA1/START domain
MIEKEPGVSLTRRIKASPAKLYDAWTDPAKLARWWAPRGVEVVSCEAEVRVGGAYRILMRDTEGRLYDLAGEYRELQPGARLAFTWGLSPEDRGSIITVTFRGYGNETELTLTHEGEADDPTRGEREQGWSSLLRRLSYFLE